MIHWPYRKEGDSDGCSARHRGVVNGCRVKEAETMFFGSDLAKHKPNLELSEAERGSYMTGGERRALRQAEKAERAFRASKGYRDESLKGHLKEWLSRKT